jgi:hypothetical protein
MLMASGLEGVVFTTRPGTMLSRSFGAVTFRRSKVAPVSAVTAIGVFCRLVRILVAVTMTVSMPAFFSEAAVGLVCAAACEAQRRAEADVPSNAARHDRLQKLVVSRIVCPPAKQGQVPAFTPNAADMPLCFSLVASP